jgi:hypothetical protein
LGTPEYGALHLGSSCSPAFAAAAAFPTACVSVAGRDASTTCRTAVELLVHKGHRGYLFDSRDINIPKVLNLGALIILLDTAMQLYGYAIILF